MPEVLPHTQEYDANRQSIYRAVSEIPPHNSYLASEELRDRSFALAAEYRNSADVDVNIRSIEGCIVQDGDRERPIEFTEVLLGGDGITIYLVGNVHTNELVWTRTIDDTNRLACEQPELFRRLGVSSIVSLDADYGRASLNDPKIFRSAFSFKDYLGGSVRLMYQVDHSYTDAENKNKSTLPGTQASEIIINALRPEIMGVLHNDGFGGNTAYATRYPGHLLNDARDLIGNHLEIDRPLCTAEPGLGELYVAKGFYGWPFDSRPQSSYTYHARKVGSRSLSWTQESAYFIVKALDDNAGAGMSIRDAHKDVERIQRGIVEHARMVLAELPARLNPAYELIRTATHASIKYQQSFLEEHARKEIPDGDREAQIREVTELFRWRAYAARSFGQACRLADLAGSSVPDAKAFFEATATELETRLSPIPTPVRDLERIQLGTMLISALALKEEKAAEQSVALP